MSVVYLIPSYLSDNAGASILPYTVDAIRDCSAFYVENERTARRFLKSLWKEMVIDDYDWVVIHKAEESVKNRFAQMVLAGRNIGIISEAGCPGVADPGQILAGVAHKNGATVRPLVGPSSILLALMASGLNGQQFRFNGYLPVGNDERMKAIRHLENESGKSACTEIFIETPYRNNQMLQTIVRTCKNTTMLSIAVNLTAPEEWIRTMNVGEWKKDLPDLHKKPVIYCLLSAGLS